MSDRMFSLLEPLEARIAPAILINPTTVTYTDVDGDPVVIHTSKPIFLNSGVANGILTFSTGSVDGTSTAHQQLETFDLTGSSFDVNSAAQIRAIAAHTNISVTTLPRLGSGGNGHVDVGFIKAASFVSNTTEFFNNIDLGTVTIGGDLGRIDVGDSSVTPSIRALNVGSMGKTSTQDSNDSGIQSNFLGAIVSFHATGDVNGARLNVVGAQYGNINKLVIDGALRGGSNNGTGQIVFTGKIGSAQIGDIVGGAGQQSGSIVGDLNRATSIGSIHVLGSITGGGGTDSGEIAAFNLPAVQVGHDVTGGTGNESGFVFGKGSIGSVTIGGSVKGGTTTASPNSGGIVSNGNINAVSIGVDLAGGDAASSGEISGTIVKSVQIGGSLKGGTTHDTGEILGGTSIGTVKIAGDIVGSSGINSGRIATAGTLAGLTVGGKIQGGGGDDSGEVLALTLTKGSVGTDVAGGGGDFSGAVIVGTLTNLSVNHSLIGGGGTSSGLISADGPTVADKLSLFFALGSIGTLHIGTNVEGGAGDSSGNILTSGAMTSLTIGGDLIGGTNTSANDLTKSGYIQAEHIVALTVTNITAGSFTSTGQIANSGAIHAGQDIGTLTVLGNFHGTAANNAIISAGGFRSSVGTTDLAIKSITINGNMDRAEILAGYDASATGTNHRGALIDSDAQIGTVHIKGNVSASSFAAGVIAGADGFFGTSDDAKGAPATDRIINVVSKIASIIVDGNATGSANGSEHFGIVAQFLPSVTITGVPLLLDNLPSTNTFTPVDNTVSIDTNFVAAEVV